MFTVGETIHGGFHIEFNTSSIQKFPLPRKIELRLYKKKILLESVNSHTVCNLSAGVTVTITAGSYFTHINITRDEFTIDKWLVAKGGVDFLNQSVLVQPVNNCFPNMLHTPLLVLYYTKPMMKEAQLLTADKITEWPTQKRGRRVTNVCRLQHYKVNLNFYFLTPIS